MKEQLPELYQDSGSGQDGGISQPFPEPSTRPSAHIGDDRLTSANIGWLHPLFTAPATRHQYSKPSR